MQLAQALIGALKSYGAGEIFGIPGDFALPFFREIERSGILPLYTLSHEPAVGFAADGSARYNSTLGVAAVTYGAGALNMVNAVACAYAEKSPLVVISGAPGTAEGEMRLGLHHQVKELDSQFKVFREITCAQTVLNDPRNAPAEIARVLRMALMHSRPVYIELPRDMVAAEIGEVPGYSEAEADPEAAATCARETMYLLRLAERPALLLGVEVRRYGLEDKVAELARKLELPTATTFMARGLMAGQTPLAIGTYLGLAGEEGIRRTVERADSLLMLGVILCDTNFGTSKRNIDMRRAIHAFDRAVSLRHHVYPEVSLAAFVDALLEIAEPVGKPRTGSTPAASTMPRPPGNAILPADIAEAVTGLFARRGRMPIASDMGDCLFTALDMPYTELAAPGYYATMGTGVPMGLGIEATSGRRPLILVGDGAFQMTGWELGNCHRYGWRPIVLVFNNTAWGMLKAFQGDTAYNDLDDWHFAAMAEPMGGRGRRVAIPAELVEALEDAAEDENHWHLIEIMIPRGAISRTLERFTRAIAKKSVLGG